LLLCRMRMREKKFQVTFKTISSIYFSLLAFVWAARASRRALETWN